MILGIAGQAGSGKDTAADYLIERYPGVVKVALADPLKRICREVFAFTDTQLWGSSEERNKPDKRYPRGLSGKYGWVCHPCKVAMYGDAPIEEKTPGRIIGSTNPCQVCGELPATDEWHYIQTPTFLTPRHALQQLGTEFGRACYENVWVEYVLRVAKKTAGPTVDDQVRYSARHGLASGADGYWGERKLSVVIPDVRFPNEVKAIVQAGGVVWKINRPEVRLGGAAGQHASETSLDGVPKEYFSAIVENDGPFEKLFDQLDAHYTAAMSGKSG